ncbi:MAG: PRC-barrel domain containing protein [Chloroflexi bacterium]|nr:PRC-barrel domain containing protein [Chloroflexota bacterium]
MMRFHHGANVYTADGDRVGEIERVIINPGTDEITHIVVQKGFIFTENRLVPISLIASAAKDRVTLREDIDDLSKLDVFQEEYYVPLGSETGRAAYPVQQSGYIRPYYYYPPVGVPFGGYESYETQPYVEHEESNIPENAVALKEGANVISADNEHVGDVEEVAIDAQSGRATHFVIAEGILLKERKLIPVRWVSAVRANKIDLSVGSDFIESLPEYEREQ